MDNKYIKLTDKILPNVQDRITAESIIYFYY